jgi:hypothetical protein
MPRRDGKCAKPHGTTLRESEVEFLDLVLSVLPRVKDLSHLARHPGYATIAKKVLGMKAKIKEELEEEGKG